jgi:hypothetical protein
MGSWVWVMGSKVLPMGRVLPRSNYHTGFYSSLLGTWLQVHSKVHRNGTNRSDKRGYHENKERDIYISPIP